MTYQMSLIQKSFVTGDENFNSNNRLDNNYHIYDPGEKLDII